MTFGINNFKGPKFNPIIVINILVQERGYKVMYNPQQHGIPMKKDQTDDKFALIYFLSKPLKDQNQDPTPPSLPPRSDSLSLPNNTDSSMPDVVSGESVDLCWSD